MKKNVILLTIDALRKDMPGCYGNKSGLTPLEKDVYFYREQDLKVIYRANLDRWEMYDLKEDPKELNNIVETSPAAEDLKSKLKPRVRRWLG